MRDRDPLIGFASVQHPQFTWLRQMVEPSHWLPQELLSGACSLVAFFLPFAPEIVKFDPETLTCCWSHKSVAAIVGLGSFGLHQMLITDQGCAGRFGSLVLDTD